MMPDKNLGKDIEFGHKHREDLLKEYANKFLLIHNQRLIGSYDSYPPAANEGIRLFGTETVLSQSINLPYDHP